VRKLEQLPNNACNFRVIELFFCGISRYATLHEIQHWNVKGSQLECDADFKTERLIFNHQALQYDLQPLFNQRVIV
jgi:hypothetical protein